MNITEGVVATLLVIGMVDPSIEREVDTGEGLAYLEESSVEGEVVVGDIVANTARNGGTDSVVDFEIGDTTIGIHKLEGNGYVGDGLAAVVGHTEGDSILFEIDTA